MIVGWIVVVIAFLGIPPIIHWLWRNWGANLWARRSRQAALWRARKTAKQLIELERLRSEPLAVTKDTGYLLGQLTGATIIVVVIMSYFIVIILMKQKGIHLGEGIYIYVEAYSKSFRILCYVMFFVVLPAAYIFLESSFVTVWFTALPLRRWEWHRETAILRAQRVLLSAGMTDEAGKQWFKALLKDPNAPAPSFLSKDRS